MFFFCSIKQCSIFFITCRNKGGGHKRLYRLIEFRRLKFGIKAKIHAIEYDPNRNCRIALLYYTNGDKSYILSPLNLYKGDVVISNFVASIKIGNSMPLANIPPGTFINSLEFQVLFSDNYYKILKWFFQLIEKFIVQVYFLTI